MPGNISRMMKQRVRRRLDILGATDAVSDAEVYCWLSEALRDISSRMPDMSLPELCTTATWGPSTSYDHLIVAAQSNYDLPSDFLRERGLKYTRVAAVTTTTWAQRIPFREMRQSTELEANASGTKPRYWIWDGEINLEVGAVGASDSFVFYYVKHPADYEVSVSTSGAESIVAETGGISDTTDPTVSRHYFRAMEEFAVARLFEIRKEWQRSDTCMVLYEKLLGELKARFVVPGDAADQYPADGVQTKTTNL